MPTWEGLRQFAQDVISAFREIPTCEYKTLAVGGEFRYPLFVSTKIANVLEVRRVQSYATKDPSQIIDDTSISWRKSSDPNQPGVLISELGGLKYGTQYTIVLAIEGFDG